MRILANDNGFEVHDLPPGLHGVNGTDLVLPTGQTVYLQGASREAHVHLQAEIAILVQSVSNQISPQMLLRSATQQFCYRLNAMAQNNA